MEVQQRLHTLAEPLSIEEAAPHHVLKRLMQSTGGRLEWIDNELALGPTSPALQRQYERERQFLAQIARMASEVKLEEIEAAIKKAQALHFADLIRQAAVDAGLNELQVNALGVALRMHANELEGGDSAEAKAEAGRLAKLREQIAAEEAQRLAEAAREEAQRLSGLTLPPAEWLPAEPEPEGPKPES